MHTEGERLARQLENDAKVAGDRLETLTASLDTVKKLASQSNEQDVQLRALERDAKTERDLLESYLAKYREATARDNINAAPPEARIISRASPAIKPNYPKKLPTVLIAAFAAFALSAGFTVTGALLSPVPSSYGYGYAPAPYVAPAYMPAPTAPSMMPRVASPPLMPAAMPPPLVASAPMAPMASASIPSAPMGVNTVEQIAYSLRQTGDAGRRVTVVGAARNAGATYAAIALSRVLAKDSNVVLVDLAFGAPNLSIISTDPKAPGIADLVRGTASFGDIITRDQYSTVHLISTGHVGSDSAMLSASPMLATVVEALVRSYDHVVIDIGSAADIEVERFAPLASRVVLVAADPANPATRAAHDRLMQAGFVDVSLMAGAPQAVAA